MEPLENLLVGLENKVKEIDASINLTFSNTKVMKQQLRHIINCQDHLIKIKLNLEEVFQATEKNSIFPIVPAALGALLTLIGGTISEFGIDVTLAAIQQHTSNEDKRLNLRQRCIKLEKNIENTIKHCENLKSVADKSCGNLSLMKYLSKKQNINNFIQIAGSILLLFIFFLTILILIRSLILFFTAEFASSLNTFLVAIATLLGAGKVANYVLKNDEQWKILISEIAENDHHQ